MKKMRKLTIYMIVSAIFLTSCVIYYGGRFIYYYSVSKGKVTQATTNLKEILTQPINLVVDGDGLHVDGNAYVYRGQPIDNYVRYSGLLWRIMGIDAEGNIRLITDEAISVIPWANEGTDYEDSLIRSYLNPVEGKEDSGIFYDLLEEPEKYLVPTSLCMDKTNEPMEVLGCEQSIHSDYVGLMNVNEYFFANGVESYLNTGAQQWTLTARSDGKGIFYIHSLGGVGDNSQSSTDRYSYGVRPVITLKAETEIRGGTGVKELPYEITEDTMADEDIYRLQDMKVGEYFHYENETWRIVGFEEGKTKAIMMDVIRDEEGNPVMKKYSTNSAKYNLKSGSIGYYLNHEYLSTFEHPEYLTEGSFYCGEFSSHSDYAMSTVKKDVVIAKVGLPQIYDMFTTNTIASDEYTGEITYWTGNYKKSSEHLTWVMRNGDWIFGDFATNEHGVRPVIYLKEDIAVVSGAGSLQTPYEIMEVAENE